eukprot:CAMPEP_0172646704 /NCGR_PEP_ID=MMETSP1068-20121228/240377_1 /TAXON_ID=35684 /ORGANISM="Pseudopedinella elastica, Strain CCMP716" /LENGTH=371 /DNA_ID=CAMNT_0013460969 /DNA_START=534 /DNA_END=1650 /DNA_ORIENTATION=-
MLMALVESECLIGGRKQPVSLTHEEFRAGRHVIAVADIVGAKLHKSESKSFFEVYAYPKVASCGGGPGKRSASHLTVEVPNGTQPGADRYVEEIRRLVHPEMNRRFLVFVNPVGGQGQAEYIFETIARPLLEQSNVDFDVVVTNRAGHAKDMVAERGDLGSFSAVLVFGGDGLLYEVVQGIDQRPDSETIFQSLPLSPICAGSGNGLCKSVLFESGEDFGKLEAVFVAVKGRPQPLDLSRVTTPASSALGFLGLGWAIWSDVDIESERWRALGSARFTVGALQRIIFLREYQGRLSYLPPSAAAGSPTASVPPLSEPVPSDWVTIEDAFVLVTVLQTSHAAHDMHSAPGSTLDDGEFQFLSFEVPLEDGNS